MSGINWWRRLGTVACVLVTLGCVSGCQWNLDNIKQYSQDSSARDVKKDETKQYENDNYAFSQATLAKLSVLLEVFEPKYEVLNEAVTAAHKKERNKDIELMRSNGQVNGAHMVEMMGYYSDIVSHIIDQGPNSDVQWVKAQKDAANAIVPKFTSVEVQNRIEQAKNLDAAIDAFVAEQSAETHHEVISQYNELVRTPMNFKLLDKTQDAYIPEGV